MSDALKTTTERGENNALDPSGSIRRRLREREEEARTPHRQADREATDLAEVFISMISSPRQEAPAGMSDELVSIQKVCAAIFEEVEQGELTEQEAEALIEFMASRFVGRRVNEIVEGLFDPGGYNEWFVAASRSSYGT